MLMNELVWEFQYQIRNICSVSTEHLKYILSHQYILNTYAMTHAQTAPIGSCLLSSSDELTTKDSLAMSTPPTVQSSHRMDQQETSEDKCKSLLCLEQSGRASFLIICTHVHFSLLCVLTCFISTVSSNGMTEVTTPPQTISSPHNTPSGMTIS